MAEPKRLAVIGAGPIGLEMALSAMNRGLEVDLFERSESISGHVRSYGFVRLFSPWRINMTEEGMQAVENLPAPLPADREAFPTGNELLEQYLEPLFQAVGPRCRGVHFGAEVVFIGRGALLKGESIGGGDLCMPKNKPLVTEQRKQTPFKILVRSIDGEETESYHEGFDFVADCSGSYRPDFANWAGAGGLPALGERMLRASNRLWTGIPNVATVDRERFAGRRTMLVGAGMSAATSARNLGTLAEEGGVTLTEPGDGTGLVWLTRSGGTPFRVNPDDVLPQRKTLNEYGNMAANGEVPGVKYIGGAAVKKIERSGNDRLTVTVQTVEGLHTEEVDEFIACCGFKPDMSLYSELQVHTCYASDGPISLAATLLGGSGDCLAQVGGGADTLKSPEPGFFILGSKSYGRNSAFLLKIGHEQVRTVLDVIA